MQSVAKRIEERCREREREREALSVARDAEVEVDRELRAASEAHQRARVAFLETVLEVHDAELGFHRRQMEKRQCVKDESRHTEWDGIIEAQIAELEASWRAEQAAMAAAVTKREAYLGWIQGAIQDVQEAQAKRKRKKELLKEHGDWLVERWNEATREADRKREEIRALRAEEANLKLRVQQVADQVRAELAKVREARLCPVCVCVCVYVCVCARC
jgi:hypothetical protein